MEDVCEGLHTNPNPNLGFVTPRKGGNCDDVTATSKASASMAATSNINGGASKDIASSVAEIRSPNHHRSPNEGWSSNDNGNNNLNTDRISVSLEETMTNQPGFLVDCHNNNGQPGIQGIMHDNRDVHVMADDGSCSKESEEGVEHGKLDQFKVNSEMGLYGLHSPKKAMDRNDNLLAIMVNTANQKDQEVIEQPKIQFGSFTYNEGSSQTWAGNKGKGIDNNVSLQDSKASKDVVQEGNGENEGWEVPKRKHVYKTRWNSVGTPLGLQIGGSSKGEDNNKAPYERTIPKGNKENLNMEEMGRGPGPPA
ncbi:hypothetical protein FRX31_009665 [Thalictrum thalictroides]|uniref:Uncharacterized protein n=1 Tax=Thalictrum thalictroides TaxID=46969 RepID=A0A7J6WTP8_THATH|nr:hypothetical protein FRX31_009665 [Thalictrum thalictroides]